jgi:ubiquinone/menaquinone biosynthesis C-methylase UbiE
MRFHPGKKYIALSRLLQNIFFYFYRVRFFWGGTSVLENEWAHKDTGAGSDWGDGYDWLNSYWNSVGHPHRKALVDTVLKYSPESVLEIGSNCGPNLRLLSDRSPGSTLVGVDINPEAVAFGNRQFAREGKYNVRIAVNKADSLAQYGDKSFDVVFTDAVLIYVGPDKIERVVKELVRIGRKGLVFVEWNVFGPKDSHGASVFYNGKWMRDYGSLLRQYVSADRIRVTKITKEQWPDKNWSRIGAIIEVSLESTKEVV